MALDYGIPNTPLVITVGTPLVMVASDSSRKNNLPFPLSVQAIPGVGGTVLVEYRLHTAAAWLSWPAGTVSATTIYLLSGPVQALRFTALVADATAYVAH